VKEDIAKTRAKITRYNTRLRELERLKIEIENAEIVSRVRTSTGYESFIESYKNEKESEVTDED
jgi:hypothetical protein